MISGRCRSGLDRQTSRAVPYAKFLALPRMRVLVLLIALAPLASTAQSDPCGLAGTYALDRAPIHGNIIASMSESLAELGDQPSAGSLAQIKWKAKREAFQRVRAEAEAGDVVPHMTLVLNADGTFQHRVRSRKNTEDSAHAGRWTADGACQELTIDVENDDRHEPVTGQIDGDRITIPNAPDGNQSFISGVSFDRVRGAASD